MLTATKDLMLPTTVTGSWPRPCWYTGNLHERPYSTALGDVAFREQHVDAVATVISDQELAGLDILTNGDYHLDNDLAGRSWFSYPTDRLSGISEFDTETTSGWSYPVGTWLNEIVGGWKYHGVVDKIGPRVPLEFAKVWRVAQSRTEQAGEVRDDRRRPRVDRAHGPHGRVRRRQARAHVGHRDDAQRGAAPARGRRLQGRPDRGARDPQRRGLGRGPGRRSTSTSTSSTTPSRVSTRPRSGCTRAGATQARSTASTRTSPTSPRSRSTWSASRRTSGRSSRRTTATGCCRASAVQGQAEQEDRGRVDQPSRAPGRDRRRRSPPTSAWRWSTSTPTSSSSPRTAGSGARACRGRSRCTRPPRWRRARTSSAGELGAPTTAVRAADPAAAGGRACGRGGARDLIGKRRPRAHPGTARSLPRTCVSRRRSSRAGPRPHPTRPRARSRERDASRRLARPRTRPAERARPLRGRFRTTPPTCRSGRSRRRLRGTRRREHRARCPPPVPRRASSPRPIRRGRRTGARTDRPSTARRRRP